MRTVDNFIRTPALSKLKIGDVGDWARRLRPTRRDHARGLLAAVTCSPLWAPLQFKQHLGFCRCQVVTRRQRVDGFREISSLSKGEGSSLSRAERATHRSNMRRMA